MKRLLAPILRRVARDLGIADVHGRLDALERRVSERRVSDELYAAIEARFRGDPSLIKSRQQQYLPYVSGTMNGAQLLDLGCGRGEWLELLRENGLPARGVDSNRAFVDSARARGLDVTEGDITDHLGRQADASLGVITMFQVAEHLPLGVLEKILSESHRVLGPGGVLIVEIPNIETLRVGAATFWIDPTHERPLFPEFLVFMVERAGFASVVRQTSTALDDTPDGLSETEASLFQRINGDGDFAVIAVK